MWEDSDSVICLLSEYCLSSTTFKLVNKPDRNPTPVSPPCTEDKEQKQRNVKRQDNKCNALSSTWFRGGREDWKNYDGKHDQDFFDSSPIT